MSILHLDPFDALLEMDQQYRTYAKPLPSQRSVGQTWQGIGFLSANIHYVAPLDEVKEVLIVPELTSVPGGVEWFRGVVNLRGHLLPVTELEAFMLAVRETNENVSSTIIGLTPFSRILVVDFEGSLVGFLVQQVLGVQQFIKEKINKSTEQYDDGEITWKLLSFHTISQMPLFNHIVKTVVA